jgi:signal transduction histidine kinase
MALVDPRGVVVAVNRRLCTLSGLAADALVGLPIARLLPECDAAGAGLGEGHAGGSATGGAELEGQAVDVTLTQLTPASQLGYGLVLVALPRQSPLPSEPLALDLHSRYELLAHRTREIARDAVDGLDEAKDAMDGARSRVQDPELRLDLQRVDATLERLAFMLSQLRRVAMHAPFGQLAHRRRQLDPGEAIDAALLATHRALPPSSRVERKYGAIRLVSGDDILLQEALSNVLANAGDALHERKQQGSFLPRLTITTEDDREAHVVIRVADNGIGIDRRSLSEVFDRGFTTKDPAVHTGEGLTLTRRIVETFGGTIQVASRAGEWTVVTLRLPAG